MRQASLNCLPRKQAKGLMVKKQVMFSWIEISLVRLLVFARQAWTSFNVLSSWNLALKYPKATTKVASLTLVLYQILPGSLISSPLASLNLCFPNHPKWRSLAPLLLQNGVYPSGRPFKIHLYCELRSIEHPRLFSRQDLRKQLDSMVPVEWVIQKGFTRVFMLFVSCFYFSLIGR